MTEEAPRETTPPPLQPIQAPSAKERKYDRQLRLWAASGQRALEESHVLLVVGNTAGSNTSVAGAETLKNLILPSIGHFTIADSAKVTEADLGVNFFLEESSLAKSRAEETTSFLQELNPDVQGHSIKDPLHDWLPKQDSLKPYNLILLPAEFPIVDTHPDPETVQDLRLLKPWDELQAAEKELGDLSQMTDHDHGHVPWLLLLLRYLQHWKQQHGGQYPSNFKEKTEFRSFVRDQARTSNAEGGEENFDEACAAVLKSISPPTLGSGCREMFNIDSCTHLTQASANFWLVANAIKQFYDKHEVLPLPGGLPDMKATSAGYIKLQTIYKAKARADIAEVTDTVRKLESSLGRPEQIAGSEIEQFCKNAAFVRVLTNHGKQPLPELRLLKGDEKTLTKLPAMLTSFQSISEVFLAMNIDFIPSSTLSELKALEDMIEGGTLEERIDKAIEEVTRTLGHEMHNTSSITGGMVAQEAIKLLTRQYVPVDGVVIWDGIRSRTEIVKI
ncbi:hypothetical protein LTR24_007980 [Lithohypha guttulata]|uniref:NEDD8-activating enzyme E1 regulatory subunit n=1 Tax=Lithohypha guttulata TaxID=1690604 RepID=A0ABR0K1X0_9EURO|nr:hypothetical protein LTR24_007980 [Lithohypha guttulata]